MTIKGSQHTLNSSASTSKLPPGTRSTRNGMQRPNTGNSASTPSLSLKGNRSTSKKFSAAVTSAPNLSPRDTGSASNNNQSFAEDSQARTPGNPSKSLSQFSQSQSSRNLPGQSHSTVSTKQSQQQKGKQVATVSKELTQSQTITTIETTGALPPRKKPQRQYDDTDEEEGDDDDGDQDGGLHGSATISTMKKNPSGRLLLSGGSTTKYTLPPDHFANRLFNTPKWKPKEEQNDAIVSDLSYESLRWIKQRRTMDSNQRVVISYIRNRQLREMFKKLDFNGHGSIELGELTDAINYAKQRITEGDAVKHFQNLDQIFADMDDNGDGTVDYQEFTKGMTGTSNSVFDKVSSFDIEKLFNLFIEYGEMRSRELAVQTLDHKRPMTASAAGSGLGSANATNATNQSNRLSVVGGNIKEPNPAIDADDYGVAMYQNFKVLFGTGNGKKSTVLEDDSGTPIWYLGKKRCYNEEKLLDRFIVSNQMHSIGCVVNEDSEMINSVSTVSGENFEHEKIYMKLHEKQRFARRDMVDELATDFGILHIQNQMQKERESKLPPKPSKELPLLSPTGSVNGLGSASPSRNSISKDNLIITAKTTKSDMAIRLQVRKDAFEAMRAGRKQRESNGGFNLEDSTTSSFGSAPKLFGNKNMVSSPNPESNKKLPTLDNGKNRIAGKSSQNSSVTTTTAGAVHPALLVSMDSFLFFKK